MNRAFLAALFILALPLAGCGQPAAVNTPAGPKAEAAKTDPWDGVAKRLRKDTDVGACRAALNQLNNDLANRPDVPGPAPLPPDAEKALAALVPLSPTDAAEVRGGSYSNLDPVYLADAFYLRDAARSLEVPGAPPEKLAEFGFAWVCRQVFLNPWVRPVGANGLEGTALPPTAILRRGSGSGLERAYVFLALLQQLGIDGCLIGPPAARDQHAAFVALGPDKEPLTGTPRGPFWAVGARVGADVLLFDPWRGEKFPGTLAQLKANLDPLKPWFEAKTPAWGVTPDEVKDARVFLAVPVSGLSPRMALLEDKLKADSGVRLAVKPVALKERFTTLDATFWNPPDDRFAFGRASATFLPADEGGLDRSDAVNRLQTQYQVSMMPRSVFVLPPQLTEAAVKERLMSAAAVTYERSFHAMPSPRERLQRAQFQDAARYLSEKQTAFTKGMERLRNTRDNELVAAWSKRASAVYADLSRAESFSPGAVPDAQAAVADFWQKQGAAAQLIVDQATAQVGRLEAMFLLALCKHEEAERQQARRELAGGERLKADAVTAWEEARNAWESYLDQPQNDAGFAARTAYVKKLADRAAALSK